MPLDPGGCRVDEELHGGSALLSAGGQNSPDAFGPALAYLAASALCDAPIDDHKTQSLFCEVIRWFDTRGGDELKVGLPMLLESCGDGLGL